MSAESEAAAANLAYNASNSPYSYASQLAAQNATGGTFNPNPGTISTPQSQSISLAGVSVSAADNRAISNYNNAIMYGQTASPYQTSAANYALNNIASPGYNPGSTQIYQQAQIVNNLSTGRQELFIPNTPGYNLDPYSQYQTTGNYVSADVTQFSGRSGSTGGTGTSNPASYDLSTASGIAAMVKASGGTQDPYLAQKAGITSGNIGSVANSRSVVAPLDLSSGMGGVNVPANYDSKNNTYMPIGDVSQQLRNGTKVNYSPGGAFDISQVVKSDTPGFERIYPMITGGGSDYALQSGMVSGKALTPVVYDEYGMTPLWTADKASTVASILANPDQYSRLGSELYGGKVSPLDGRTMQDQFTNGTVSTMPGRYAPESMNYAMLPGLLSPNTQKGDTGTQYLSTGASPTLATDAAFRIVNRDTGLMENVTPNWNPVTVNVVPKEQPEYIMVRPADIARTYSPVQPTQGESPKYQSQFGGYLINNPSFNVTQELQQNKDYNANSAMMWSDRQNNEKFANQTWMEPQGWTLQKNPLYQSNVASEPTKSAATVSAAIVQPYPTVDTFNGMKITAIDKMQSAGFLPTDYTQAQPNKYPGDGGAHDALTFGVPGAAAFNRGVIANWDNSPQFSPTKTIEGVIATPGVIAGTIAGFYDTASKAAEPTTKPFYGYTNTTIGTSGSNQSIVDLRADITARQPGLAGQYANLTAQNLTAKSPTEISAYNSGVADYNAKNKVFTEDVARYNAMDRQNPQMTTVMSIANVAPNTTPKQAVEGGGKYWTGGGLVNDTYTKAVEIYGSVPAPLKAIGAGITSSGVAESAIGVGSEFILPVAALPATIGAGAGLVGVAALEYSGRLGLTGKTDQYSVRTAGEQFGATSTGKSILSVFTGSELPNQKSQYSEVVNTASPNEISQRPIYSEIPNYQPITAMTIQKQWEGSELPAYAIGGATRTSIDVGKTPTAYKDSNQMSYAEKIVNENPVANAFAYPLDNQNANGYNNANAISNPLANPNSNLFQNPNALSNPVASPLGSIFASPFALPNPNANPNSYPNIDVTGRGQPQPEPIKLTLPTLPQWGGSGGGSMGGAKGGRPRAFTNIFNVGEGLGNVLGMRNSPQFRRVPKMKLKVKR